MPTFSVDGLASAVASKKSMNNRISPVAEYEKGEYLVLCKWSGSVEIEKQFYEARDSCQAFNVLLSHRTDEEHATLSGVSFSPERSEQELTCIRDYFIKHFGWVEDEGVFNSENSPEGER